MKRATAMARSATSTNTDKNTFQSDARELEGQPRYRAPALEKGLDILEMMAREGIAMTPSQIAAKLNRSVSELFRMILTLEARGYIAQSANAQGFDLTNKLFALGSARSQVKTLLETALPIMHELTQELDQSCHLVVASGDQIVVIARVENPGLLGFSVRPGFRKNLIDAVSGLTLFAFQPKTIRNAWLSRLRQTCDADKIERFVRQADAVRALGFTQAGSDFVQGVTDLSAPVMAGTACIAALTVPFVQRLELPRSMAESLNLVCASARRISQPMI
jgi:DNA-binding IclR family transcriptional regulator